MYDYVAIAILTLEVLFLLLWICLIVLIFLGCLWGLIYYAISVWDWIEMREYRKKVKEIKEFKE